MKTIEQARFEGALKRAQAKEAKEINDIASGKKQVFVGDPRALIQRLATERYKKALGL